MESHEPKTRPDPEEPPPIFGSWGRFYAVVMANTVLVVLLLYLFSRCAGQ